MPRIALTGGIACGKSLLSSYLNELGVETIDADDVAHELLPDPAERRRIAAEVFADPAKRRELEARLHPQIKARIDEFLGERDNRDNRDKRDNRDGRDNRDERDSRDGRQSLQSRSSRSSRPSRLSRLSCPSRLRLAIIPLLFETHWDSEYDIICCVASTREQQVSRMMTTRGYTSEEAEARLAAQLPVEEKAARSHYVIDNNGTPEELKEKAKRFVEWLKNSTFSQDR